MVITPACLNARGAMVYRHAMPRLPCVGGLALCGLLGCGPGPVQPSGPVTLAPEASASGAAPPALSARPAPAPGAPAPSDAVTMWVREGLVDCEGEGPMKCMQVRDTEGGEWRLFYGRIEGFTHDPAFAYELRVTVEPSPPGRPGASARRYHLVDVVAKKAANRP